MNNLQKDYPEKYEELIVAISEKSGCEVEDIKAAKNMRNDLMFDSLDEVETVMEAESMFDIQIRDEIVEGLDGDIDKLCDAVWGVLKTEG